MRTDREEASGNTKVRIRPIRDRSCWTCLPLALAMVFASGVSQSRAEGEPSLRVALDEKAPSVIRWMKTSGHKSVGFLKFSIDVPGAKNPYRVGELNLAACDRLQRAVLLANPDNESEAVLISLNANAEAATRPGADTTTLEGRQILFKPDYLPSWGTARFVPDVFVLGKITASEVRESLQLAQVQLLAIERKRLDAAPIKIMPEFTVTLDAGELTEIGRSYQTFGVVDDGKPKRQGDARTGVKPLDPQQAPFQIQAISGNLTQVIDLKQSTSTIPEPAAGASFSLKLIRNSQETRRLGVVIKVNGQSTIAQETKRDSECRLWVVEPNQAELVIPGFQMDLAGVKLFKIASLAETETLRQLFGSDTGLITVAVYAEFEKKSGPGPAEVPHIQAITDGRLRKPAKNLGLAKATVNLTASKPRLAGVIIADEELQKRRVNEVEFNSTRDPVQSVSIRYLPDEPRDK